MNNNVPVPVICLLGRINFSPLLGRSLPHSLSFEGFQISASGTFSTFSCDVYLPDSGEGTIRSAM